MLFLDTSTLIDYNDGVESVKAYVDDGGQLFTSSLCVYELVEGEMWATNRSAHAIRREFGEVESLALNEEIALEAARMQNDLRRDGDEMSVRDLLIAATARSTGAELVVADDDFETDHLEGKMEVTNLADSSA